MAERYWFISVNGEQSGPFPESQIGALIGAGRITGDTFVWTDGMSDWQRAAYTPGFVFLTKEPPPPAAQSLPFVGASVAHGSDGRGEGGPISADFGVWTLFWRSLLLMGAMILIIPLPWAMVAFCRWLLPHIHVPKRPNLSFTGKVGDIWWVFVLIGLYVIVQYYKDLYVHTGAVYIDIASYLVEIALLWMLVRWFVSNISSDGRPLSLRFTGSLWGYMGWHLLMLISMLSIVGWAWVQTALQRWLARNIGGTMRPVFFNATGWGVLWRITVLSVTSILIIPIPWTMNWYFRWFLSQFSVGEKMA
jgi:hypothetical protein